LKTIRIPKLLIIMNIMLHMMEIFLKSNEKMIFRAKLNWL